MKKSVLIALAAIALLATGCTKRGPQGPQGPAGVQGANGADGKDGRDGAVVVIGSDHILVTNWEYANNTYSATFNYAEITSDIANYGLVQVYKKYSDGSWTPLPDVNNGVSTVYNFSAGTFTIYIFTVDGSTTPAPGNITFRAVIIPSSVRKANPHADWKNLETTLQILRQGAEDNS